jgi:transporter family-2 protein
MIALQSVLSSSLGLRVGNIGSGLVLTLVSVGTLLIMIAVFPSMADFSNLPGRAEWYLYAGGVLGVLILLTPIILVPRIGVTSTLVALVLGQMLFSILLDHFGLLATPEIKITSVRVIGVVMVATGAYLVTK